MRRSYVVLVLCLLAVVGAWLLWSPGRRGIVQKPAKPAGVSAAAVAATATTLQSGAPTVAATLPSAAALTTNKLTYRLANTTNSVRQLELKPHALLLANAFIDTDKPLDFKIPSKLQLKGDPGAYIIQARGGIDARFRNTLAAAGAEIVSYIPNNAYLVRMTAAGAGKLAGSPVVQALLPYEPYYKVQASLLGLAVNEQPLPPGTALNVGLFGTDAAATETALRQLGAKIIGRDRSPFGPILRVLAPADWTAVAQVPGVQAVEVAHTRVFANDLSRVTVGVSPDTTSGLTNSYAVKGFVLTGSNVLVQVNDSGVDTNHPDLNGRVTGLNYIDMVDTNGHGTHVAGIIASSGVNSMKPPGPTDVGANAEGSVTNADFRGKAPLANLFSLRADNSDYELQTNAALIGALISNNSWDYGNGAADYDMAAASYDFATRDAVPGWTGSQPVLFVFAAGNSGGGDNDGAQGSGDTILSPGTAKNVVTVGALEQYRNLTNIVTFVSNGQTNKTEYWKLWTDTANQVAWYSSRGNVGVGTEGAHGRFKPDLVSPGTFVVSTRSGQWDTNAYYNPTNISGTAYTYQVATTNDWVYYTVAVPPNAISVTINISPNKFSPSPFPDLWLYAKQAQFPTTNSYDILKTTNSLSIPPDNGGAISGIQAIQGNGFSFAVANTNGVTVAYNLTVSIMVTNDIGDMMQVLEGMNENMAPYYRYESGTSMSAADVSGVLALVADYFTNQFQPRMIPSPALMKALLINGCRSIGNYGYALTNDINFQGWGLDNIQNIIPIGGEFNQADGTATGSSFFVEQNPTNALATGDSHTFFININTNDYADYLNLQATLVWTDPPGDPSAALKLVNNLDIIMTNLDTGDVYFGNDIAGDGFNSAWDTNSLPNLDMVNNVKNILLPAQLAGRYSLTVLGRSVNVNAVTAQTNNYAGQYAPNIVQDFSLVVSVGEGELTNAFTVTDGGIVSNPTGYQDITVVTTTNAPLFNQYVGASSPLLGTNTLALGTNTVWGPNGLVTIGMTNQWHFYIVTNTGPQADFTNAAFITFQASTLSIPRMGVYEDTVANATRPEADIDLFVSQDAALTNLSPVTISNCLAGNGGGFGVNDGGTSLGQGGTEFVFFTNSSPQQVYYVGVKSEDQMGSEYAFMPIFTDIPFSQLDQNGNQIVHGLLLPQNIPDGNNAHPGITNVFALAIMPMVVQKVTVTNLDQHQNFGDLFGTLTFGSQHVVLNNHDGFGNTMNSFTTIAYDDSRNKPLGTTNTDGPGTLTDFRGKSALGPWILGVMDNALTQTGLVRTFDLKIQPHRNLKQPGVIVAVPPGGWFIDYVDVPAGYTNLTINATNVTVPTPGVPAIELYEKYGNEPTLTDFDQEADLTNGPTPPGPGNSISVGPPLPMGQYFVGLFNPSSTEQNVFISVSLGINATVNDLFNYSSSSGQSLGDDAVTPVQPNPPLPGVNAGYPGSYISVPATQLVASVNVGIVMQTPRISDYTFTLVSPTGQRVLLMENRGGGDTNGAGLVFVYTNQLNSTANGGAAANTNSLAVAPGPGSFPLTYNFYTVPDQMTIYETNANLPTVLIFDTGFTSNSPSGPGAQNTVPVTTNITYNAGYSNIVIIMNQFGNPFAGGGDAWDYTVGAAITNYEYLMFTDDTNLATVPIKYAAPPYSFSLLSSNYALSDFNLATNGDYLGLTNVYDAFGGWTVPTNLTTYPTILTNVNGTNMLVGITNVVYLSNNLVSVVSDPSTSLTGDAGGSNYLALGMGTITRNISTVPGRKYNVTFWYRGAGIEGWWRGEGDAIDSSDPEKLHNNGTLIGRFNFPAGEVGQAYQFEDPGNTYQFAATNTYVQVRASDSLNVGAGGGFSIEGWINPTNLSRPQPLVEWLAKVPTNTTTADTNLAVVQGPMLSPVTGHYYYLLAATNWLTSEGWATNLGGHLATVETANEENWIYDTFTAYGTTNRYLWIGYTNSGPSTPFAWVSGITNTTYTNWMAAQPTNCDGTRNYTLILSPTNTLPGLWAVTDTNGFICGSAATNQVFGVVEVTDIPTNGVQFWISGTNWTPGYTNVLQGCLYANIVDTNYVSHEIFSAPGLLQSNVYQHIALTFNTNSGIAALYLNGTNVATSNLFAANGPFVPKTDGDVLLGWDMSRYTNNFYAGKMDEMSIYSRPLSLAEISAIYHASADTTNRLLGKFDPTITPAVGLAEALVTFGSTSNIIFGLNDRWSLNSYTFTATTNSMPLTISGLEPGILLDSFAVSEAPLTNLYYFPEEALSSLNGDSAFGNWMLQIWDNRAGAYVTNANQLLSWQLSFVLVSNAVISASLPPQTPVQTTVPAGGTVYYAVTVPQWAHFATNIVVSSDFPVNLYYFSPTNIPTTANLPELTMLTGVTSGTGPNAILVTNGTPQALWPNQTYYLGVQNTGSRSSQVVLEVDYDIVALTNGVPFTSDLNTNEYNSARYFQFDVSSNAYEATFQLLKLSGNADLVVRKGVPLPDLSGADHGSFNASTADENIYVLTNSTPVPLSAGRWYLGVMKRDGGDIQYSVLAKELDLSNNVPNIFYLTNGVPFTWTAGPGAALTNFFCFRGTNFANKSGTNFMGVRFETYNQTGNGDLTLQTNAPPYAPQFFQSSQNPAFQPELIIVRTNSALTNLMADWYLGVPNHELTNITYTIIAEIQTNLYFPAFPDAQGAGQGAIGGRFSTVYHVTTNGDSGPGTLRAAVGSTNRTVIFDIGGTIYLTSPLVITNSYLTIAGQTAPGGITVVGNMTTIQSAHDVIIRDVRFRSAGAPAITNATTAWSNGFENFGTPGNRASGTYFCGGWYIASGSIDVGDLGNAPAYDGVGFVDLNGTSAGTILTNVATVVGQKYSLNFAYSQNPDGVAAGVSTMTADLYLNSIKRLGLSVQFPNTSWSTLSWARTSVVFTATSPTTQIRFVSTTPNQYGVLLDGVSLVSTSVTYANTGDSLQFLNVSNVIADHISAEWSSNNLVSTLNSSNVTVQWSIMADGITTTNASATNSSLGSLMRYGNGTLSFHHNLYADNYSGSPRLGDNLTLDFVNNVVYNWGLFSGLSGGTNDVDVSVNGCTNLLNYVCNYLIAGPDTARFATNYSVTNIAFFGGTTNALFANWIFQTNNFIDSDTNGILNGANTGWNMFTNNFTRFSRAFPTPPVSVDEAYLAYEKVLDFAGVNVRDAVDTNIATKVRYQTNGYVITVPVTNSDLVAWWKAESNYLDSAGSNNGSPQNGTGLFGTGKIGTAFNLSGGQFVLVNATTNLNVGLGAGFTIAGWVNPTDLSGNRPVIEFERNLGTFNGSDVGIHFYISLNGQPGIIYANIIDTANNPHSISSPVGTITTAAWQYVAVTYDKASGLATLYTNGTMVVQQNLGTFTPQTSFTNVLIGARTTFGSVATPSDQFAGKIDELSVYDRALSSNEVVAIYSRGANALTVGSPAVAYLDTDQDGLPDFWENTFTTNLVFIPSNNNDRNGDGYTDLEEYNNWLASPHALTTVTNPVAIDLYQLCGNSGHLAFGVTNALNGTVYLTNVLGGYTNTTYFSNNFAIFTPANNAGTNFYGYASFGFYVTNLDTMGYFGPVTVSVLVSAVPLATNPPQTIIELTNGVAFTNSCAAGNGNTGGSTYYHIAITTNDYAALFELDNPSGPMAMAIRYGLPLPSLSSYDYFTNQPASPGNQEIAVITNSLPVPLTNGDWYLAAINLAGAGTCESYSVKVTTLHNIQAPLFLFPTNTTVTNIVETVSNAINCVATDPNSPPLPLSFALVSGPAGMSVSNGVIYWTPAETNGPSTNSVAVSVSNGAFSITNTFTVIVEESNLPPTFVLTNIPNQLVIMPPGTFVFTNAATDSDYPTNPLTYALFSTVAGTNLPTIDINTGVISWTATTNDLGTNYLFTTVVTDTNPWAINQQSFSVTNTFSVFVLPPLPPGGPNTNVVPPGGINWFAITVPTNAICATNTLLLASLPVNLWFSTNVPPTITNTADAPLLINQTNGVSVLSTNLGTAPTNIVPGGVYFLGVQNTNSVAVTNAIRVDFAYAATAPVLPNIPIQVVTGGGTLVVTNTATDTSPGAVLVYRLTNSPAGAVIDSSGIITWPTTTNIAPTNVVITTIVTDTTANLSATNSFVVMVLPGLVVDQPQTNVVGPNGISWFAVKVPSNAVQATNILLFATAPVNLWFSTNVPPTITNSMDAELLTNSVGGRSVVSTNTAVPPTNTVVIVPGSTYYLGVQNTNSFAVTNAVEVDFNLVVPRLTFASIMPTNMAGSNGLLLTWFAPTNYQFHLQWSPTLVPPVWSNFNGVISFTSYITASNSLFQYFDDGSQTGGFSSNRFYRLLLLDSPTNTAPFFVRTPGTLNANPNVLFIFTNSAKDWDIPAQGLTYTATNSLGDTNLTINGANGVISWTPTVAQLGQTNYITTTVTDSGVPAKGAVNVFIITVTTNSAAATPAFGNISVGAGGLQFQWTAPTNEQFQIRWTTNLAPPVWTTFPNIITSTTTNFSFTDTNSSLLLMKFYQLILLP